MLTPTVVPLLAAWAVAVISPGPDFLAVLRTSASSSRRSGVFVAVGVVSGIGCWALAALAGISVLLDRYEHIYLAVRLAGALFLIGYGLLTLRNAWQHTTAPRTSTRTYSCYAPLASATTTFTSWRLGLLTNLSNPKAVAFFGALFASLLPPTIGTLEKVALLLLMLAIALTWFIAIALLASAPVAATAYLRRRNAIDGITGALFVILGGALIPR